MSLPFRRNQESEITLEGLVRDPTRVEEVRPEQIPELLGNLEELKARLWVRLSQIPSGLRQESDELLDAKEAANILRTTPDWLYRHKTKLPFCVELSSGQVRFSKLAIQKFIKNRQKRV